MIKHKKQKKIKTIFSRIMANKVGFGALLVIVVILSFAVFADFIVDYETLALGQNPTERLQEPSSEHIFGTDSFGRDIFARIIHGSRYSLTFGIGCSLFILIGGSLLGGLSAYLGGRVDDLIMRGLDAFMCIPSFLLAMALISVIGMGLYNIMIALVITSVPGSAKMIRSLVLTIVHQEYVEAAELSGASNFKIIVHHILPNASGQIIVNTTMSIAGLIMLAAGLGFLGLGIQPPMPEWGSMLSEGIKYMRVKPHVMMFPGLTIVMTALAFNLLGDTLADAFDPRLH